MISGFAFFYPVVMAAHAAGGDHAVISVQTGPTAGTMAGITIIGCTDMSAGFTGRSRAVVAT